MRKRKENNKEKGIRRRKTEWKNIRKRWIGKRERERKEWRERRDRVREGRKKGGKEGGKKRLDIILNT